MIDIYCDWIHSDGRLQTDDLWSDVKDTMWDHTMRIFAGNYWPSVLIQMHKE